MKEFLSQVPNLYVEDAAVCSGRCAEMRIRSVTNDPVTAMALKNMLVYPQSSSSRLAPHAQARPHDSPPAERDRGARHARELHRGRHGRSLQRPDRDRHGRRPHRPHPRRSASSSTSCVGSGEGGGGADGEGARHDRGGGAGDGAGQGTDEGDEEGSDERVRGEGRRDGGQGRQLRAGVRHDGEGEAAGDARGLPVGVWAACDAQVLQRQRGADARRRVASVQRRVHEGRRRGGEGGAGERRGVRARGEG